MQIISAVLRKEVITVFTMIYNQLIMDRKCENSFDTLAHLNVLGYDKSQINEVTTSLVRGLISFSINENRAFSAFSYVEVGDKFEIIYKFNPDFINICSMKGIDVDYNAISSLSDNKIVEFYLALKTNEKGYFAIDGLKDIFDAHYRFSDDKDFIHNVVRPALEQICKTTDLKITNFKKVRNKDVYTFHKEEKVYMLIDE